MTTTFELSSAIDIYQAYGISRVVDPYSVYHSLSRLPATRVPEVAPSEQARTDVADISTTSSLVAAALTDTGLQSERIAALRATIAAGTYHVPADAVAGSILRAALLSR